MHTSLHAPPRAVRVMRCSHPLSPCHLLVLAVACARCSEAICGSHRSLIVAALLCVLSALFSPAEQRARMAALGALGATGMISEASSAPGGSGSEAGTGTVSPQGPTRRSPQFSPSHHGAAGQNLGSLSLSRNATGNGSDVAAGGSPMAAGAGLQPLDPSLGDDSLARVLASPSIAGMTSPEPVDGVAAMLERNRTDLDQTEAE